ncbi:MAG: serine hydrolase [Lachnospiraceae bacterium]|nr:serine hydrolase [Butyrivibrio sp.]MCM1342268.1 serine hydrolase [Muribaculaceae bacterium]MCM1409157.1 serine hydrolase [Lachnospiraceae bacterium]
MIQQDKERQSRTQQEQNMARQESRSSTGRQIGDWQEEGWTKEDWLEEQRKEEERQRRRRQRIEQMKREKYRREMMFRYGVPCAAVVAMLCVIFLVAGIVKAARPKEGQQDGKDPVETLSGQGGIADNTESGQTLSEMMQTALATALRQTQPGDPPAVNAAQPELASAIGMALLEAPKPVFAAQATAHTDGFGDSIISPYGILIDVGSREILAQKSGWERINPASMTKILTLLVAAEHITDLDDTFTMTIDITDYAFIHDCSNAGFEVGEEIPLKDLFYGTALPSGADAALGLAVYVAGSQEAFVDMMNEKLKELGLSETTHFTNCIGLYDQNHYSTAYDMAVILKEAADNELCRQVLSEHRYATTSTAAHSEGIDMSNLFLRRIEDRDTHGEVLCAKTGFVDQSLHCAASLAADHSGREYICVTAGAGTTWSCIADHVALYQRYLPE